jgi:hypothetical protein
MCREALSMLWPSDAGTDLIRTYWRTVATLVEVASIDLVCDLLPVHGAAAVAEHPLDCLVQIHGSWHGNLVPCREADPRSIEPKIAR